MRRVVFSHAITFALGALYLAWLALPLGAGQWRIDSTIHWWWLLVPAVLVGVGAGVCQGLLIGFGRFWPTLVPLTLASPLALWSSAVLVAPSLFGSDPEQPTPDLLIAAVAGWVLYVGVAALTTLGIGRGVASMVTAARYAETSRAGSVVGPS